MAVDFYETLSILFGILALFFLTVSIVLWFGFHIHHDIVVLTGISAKRAIKKIKDEKQTSKLAAKKKNKTPKKVQKTAILNWGNTGEQQNEIEKTVLLSELNK